jgi:hypothetical protein
VVAWPSGGDKVKRREVGCFAVTEGGKGLMTVFTALRRNSGVNVERAARVACSATWSLDQHLLWGCCLKT